MTEIYRIENNLQTPYRETAKNRDIAGGWSTMDDPETEEAMSPKMYPSMHSYDPENVSLTAPMGEEFTQAHKTRVKHSPQYSDDLFDVYYQEYTPLYPNSEFTKLMMELDGDAHEYTGPIRFWSIPDAKIAAQDYTCVWVRRLVRTIDVDRSRVDKNEWHRAIKEPPNRKSFYYSLKSLTPESKVVYRSALDAGLAVWRDRDTRALFCTQAFRDRAIDTGARGLKFSECTVVDG